MPNNSPFLGVHSTIVSRLRTCRYLLQPQLAFGAMQTFASQGHVVQWPLHYKLRDVFSCAGVGLGFSVYQPLPSNYAWFLLLLHFTSDVHPVHYRPTIKICQTCVAAQCIIRTPHMYCSTTIVSASSAHWNGRQRKHKELGLSTRWSVLSLGL